MICAHTLWVAKAFLSPPRAPYLCISLICVSLSYWMAAPRVAGGKAPESQTRAVPLMKVATKVATGEISLVTEFTDLS